MPVPDSFLPVSLGTDLVETHRIAQMLQDHGDKFLHRCFTQQEQDYCLASGKRKIEHLSARFAAKEAVLKALGTGLTRGIHWTDIQVIRDPSGKPSIHLSGQALAVAQELGITHWLISLSHVSSFATATAIGLRSSQK